ncbi:MAG: LacI family transcriptional regulator [Firmicutes bacterium HGW-Firmicutes-16]|nr:MAG: LacI family transcriptional regulator [Firmicutes bacterium HGW-Firmicutes-16]
MTIKEIAALAGTSRGTVDRVLNGRGNVNSELADRIISIATQNNYQPNQHAQALIKSRKHMTIGVVINSLGNEFFDDVLRGIHDRAQKYLSSGFSIIVKEIKGYDGNEQISAIDMVLEHDVDALAIMPLDLPEVREKLKSLKIPIVMFNTDIQMDKLAFVGCDYYNSGGLSGDIAKLIMGSRGGKIGIVIGSFMMQGHKLRISGFTDSVNTNENMNIVACVENADDDSRSYEVTKELISEHHPDLIYFGAAGVKGGVEAVLDSNENIQIITVDETTPTREYLDKGVISATVTQQPYIQGVLTIKILYNYLSSKKPPRERYNYTENQVKLRNSK